MVNIYKSFFSENMPQITLLFTRHFSPFSGTSKPLTINIPLCFLSISINEKRKYPFVLPNKKVINILKVVGGPLSTRQEYCG